MYTSCWFKRRHANFVTLHECFPDCIHSLHPPPSHGADWCTSSKSRKTFLAFRHIDSEESIMHWKKISQNSKLFSYEGTIQQVVLSLKSGQIKAFQRRSKTIWIETKPWIKIGDENQPNLMEWHQPVMLVPFCSSCQVERYKKLYWHPLIVHRSCRAPDNFIKKQVQGSKCQHMPTYLWHTRIVVFSQKQKNWVENSRWVPIVIFSMFAHNLEENNLLVAWLLQPFF